MTKINRITIQGFKSFAHKTEIPFNDKFNCILGPNGSGKSNIGDAICFVLGRLSAKSLRAEKASHLIFNGGKNKKPAAEGTVEIAFSNESKEFPLNVAEIVVGRTILKNGNSIYKINNKKCTRSEIVDVLSHAKINPDGYNIILQGDITRFVTMSSLERRKIIEEISDVSLYEEKKHKALLEMEKVEEKLNSAEIILKERKTYLKELKKDRDQALQFKEIKDKIDAHKATYLHLQMEEKNKLTEEHDQEREKHQTALEKAEKEVNVLKEKINLSKEKINKINHDIEQKGEKEQVRVHKEIEDLKISLIRDKTRVSTLKDEINKIKMRKDQFRAEIHELEEKTTTFTQKQKEIEQNIKQKQREQEELEKKISEFKKKNKIESSQAMEKEIEDLDKATEEKQEEVQKIRQQQQEALREKDRLEYQVQTIDERINKVKEVETENKDQIKQLQQIKTEFKNSTLRLNQCLDQDNGFASQLANARRTLNTHQEEQAKLNAKAMSIQASISSNNAVKSILDNKKKFNGVHGTIAELGQVQRVYAQAMETAAGAKMHHLIVDTDQTAAECIKHLKNNKLGTAAFIPLNKIKFQDLNKDDEKYKKEKGVHDFAINLVSFKPQYKKAFSYVFGNTLIVEDIETARKVGIGQIKMTTLDGSAVEASGVMRGGFITAKKISSFQEKDSLESLEKIEGEINSTQEIIRNIEAKRLANEKEIVDLRKKKGELEGEMMKLEKTLHLNTDDLDATKELKAELAKRLTTTDEGLRMIQRDINTINHNLANLKSKKQMLRSEVSALRDPRLLAQLSAFEETKQKCREDFLRLENELKSSNMQIDQMIAPEREKIHEIIKQHEKEEKEFLSEINQLGTKITLREEELQDKEKASKEFYAKYKELFIQREKLTTEINKAENDTENVRSRSRNSERELNLVSLKNAEIKAKLAGLQEEFSRYQNVPLLKEKNIPEIQKEMNKYEIMLGQMAAVNMKALEVYEKVEVEFNALVEKRESLLKEKTDVLTLMNEIETKKKEQFMKTFQRTNENFVRIFSSLFKKGKAYLQLDNNQNPFDDGLSIKVKITGNRFLDLKSLSGGEKTLTALSLIFAIQEYQPASFYILDEIDAALDKHNAETLAQLLRSYAKGAQYITISHNDSIIAEADTLFGVSMNEGVSKITSLQI